MTVASGSQQTNGTLFERMSPEVREALVASRAMFEEAGLLWKFFSRYEEPILDWEKRVAGGTPKGRRWRSLLNACTRAIEEASTFHADLRKKELAALERFQAALEMMREGAEEADPALPEGMLDVLEKWARLRSVELEWLDGALQHSQMILNLTPQAKPAQVLTLVELRRRYIGQAELVRRESERLAREAAEGNGAGGKGPATAGAGEPWRGWLKSVSEEAAAPREAEPEPKPGTPAEAEGAGPRDAAEKDGRDAMWGQATETKDRRKRKGTTLLGRFDSLLAQVEQLRRMAEVELKDLDRRAQALAGERDEIAARLAAVEKETREKLGEADREVERLRGEMAALEKERDEIRADLARREEEIAGEREELEARRREMEEEVRSARKERDEALALITSLTKRLGTPGVEEG